MLFLVRQSRKDFNPAPYRRVCSAYFTGGRKKYSNNVPTIVAKSLKLSVSKKRDSANCSSLRTRITDEPKEEERYHYPVHPPK